MPMIVSGKVVLAMKPAAPAARARTRTASSSRPDMSSTGRSGHPARIVLVKAKPSSPGRPISTMAASGTVPRSTSSASAAVAAQRSAQSGRRACAMCTKPPVNSG